MTKLMNMDGTTEVVPFPAVESVAGDDCGFDVAAAVQHVSQNLLQARQWRLPGDIVGGTNLLGRDQSEGSANGFGSVMERGLESHLGIVQAIGVELHFGSAGAAAEEIHSAALADHFDRPLPRVGLAHGFDDHVAAALLRRERTNGFDHIRNLCDLYDLVRAHVLGSLDLAIALDDRDDVAADGASNLHEHESERPAAEDGDRVADLDASFVETAKNAGQRLGHGGIFEADVGRNDQHVGFNNAARHANVLSVSAVVEEQVFAEIFLVLGAVKAHLARGGVERDDAHALLEAVNSGSDLFDDAGQFVAEERGGNNHAGMVAALIDLQVCATG